MHNIKTWHRNYITEGLCGTYRVYDVTQQNVLHQGLSEEDAIRMLDNHYRCFKHVPSYMVHNVSLDKPIAVIDVDGVMAHSAQPLQDCLDKAFDKTRPWKGWSTYDLYSHYGVELEDTLVALNNEKHLFRQFEPTEQLAETMTHLRETYHVAILTARGIHHNGLPDTAKWLQEHDVPYDSLHVVGLDDCKLDYIREVFGKASILVEDSPSTATRAVTGGIVDNVFVVTQPWNELLIGDFIRLPKLSSIKLHTLSKLEKELNEVTTWHRPHITVNADNTTLTAWDETGAYAIDNKCVSVEEAIAKMDKYAASLAYDTGT